MVGNVFAGDSGRAVVMGGPEMSHYADSVALAVSLPAGRFQYFNRFLECHDWNDRGLGFLFLYT